MRESQAHLGIQYGKCDHVQLCEISVQYRCEGSQQVTQDGKHAKQFSCGTNMSATRYRLIGPKALEAQLALRPTKSCLWRFVMTLPRINLLLFCGTSSSVSLRSNRQIISNALTVFKAMEARRNSCSQAGDRAKRTVPLGPRAVLTFSRPWVSKSEHAATRKRAAKLMEWMPTKTRPCPQTGANSKKLRDDSDVRSCSGTLKGMALGFEGGFIWGTHTPNKTQHRNRVDLDITQPLNKTLS